MFLYQHPRHLLIVQRRLHGRLRLRRTILRMVLGAAIRIRRRLPGIDLGLCYVVSYFSGQRWSQSHLSSVSNPIHHVEY